MVDDTTLKNKLLIMGMITPILEPFKEEIISDSMTIKSKLERAVEIRTNEKLFAVPIYFFMKSMMIAIKI